MLRSDRTILDYLNADCWRALLKYVPVRDLICSERTSRGWQTQVLSYLRGIQINVVDDDGRPKERNSNVCTLKLLEDDYESFTMWTSKLGTTVVSTYCNSLETLKIIHDNCPNLEGLMFLGMEDVEDWWDSEEDPIPYNLQDDFMHLQRLYFYSCSVSDADISDFIANKAITELHVHHCDLEGDFLFSINLSQLKYLTLEKVDGFDPEYLGEVEQLSELRKLVITDMPCDFSEHIQDFLHMMEKLEHLELYNRGWMTCQDYEPLSRLKHLKYLRTSMQMNDAGVEAVLMGCKELRTLELTDCQHMSGSVVANAICQYGAKLRSLTLQQFLYMNDDDLVAIIAGCPDLKTLAVSDANLSPALPARAAAARGQRPRLHLDLSDTILVEPDQLKEHYGDYEPMETDYENLVIDLVAKD